jgi:hypothetical protein
VSKNVPFGDWLAISDAIHTYCRGLDRRDAASLSSVFWPDATINLGQGTELSGAVYAQQVIPALERLFDRTTHRITNILMDVEQDRGTSECSLWAYHAVRQEAGVSRDVVVAGRYLDRWEKRFGEWRMIRRELVWDWHRTLGDTHEWSQCILGVPELTGGHSPSDPLYSLFPAEP